MRNALVKEKGAKEEAVNRAEELAELLEQAKASNKKRAKDTTKLLQKAKEQSRADVSIYLFLGLGDTGSHPHSSARLRP